MGKKKRNRNRKPQQRRRTRHLSSVPPHDRSGSDSRGPDTAGDGPENQALFQSLRRALRADHPMDLLATVSAFLNITDPRMRSPFAQEEEPQTTLESLLDSFVGVDYAETTAALTVLQHLVPDELLAARIGRVLKGRRQPVPAWLEQLGSAEVTRVVELTHILGDGDDYFVEVSFPTGEALTALVYVDHNMGGIVKDAFVIPEPVATVQQVFLEKIDDPDATFAAVDPAEARATVEQAIDWGARTLPQPETDTWPGARPLVEWMVGMLPPGGEPRTPREWTEEEREALRADFFASSYGKPVDGGDARGLVEDFIWYGSGYGSGDPLRWSSVRVELLLVDWIPRKIVADVGYLAKAPDLLRRFIRFCHDRVALRPALTDEVLAAVGEWEPEYQRLIRTERLQGAAALAHLALEASEAGEYDDEDDRTIAEIMLDGLDHAVGGRRTLMDLDTSPLPEEPFEWAGIPDDIHDRVRDVLELCDRCADELFDIEHKTAFRRFLGRAAAADPAIFRRKGAANRAAAAICWAVGRANESVGTPDLQSQELEAWFGVKGAAAQRAEVFLRANGVDPHGRYTGVQLATPDLLTSSRRSTIAALRDQYLTWEE